LTSLGSLPAEAAGENLESTGTVQFQLTAAELYDAPFGRCDQIGRIRISIKYESLKICRASLPGCRCIAAP
jgi:hypothetical protein